MNEAIAPAPPPAVNMALLVEKYRQLRDKKKALADAAKEAVRPIDMALDEIEAVILDALNRGGVESIRTASGTAYKQARTSYTVHDPAAFREWLESAQRYDLLETRVSKESIETMLQSGAQLPPGIRVNSEVVVNIRK